MGWIGPTLLAALACNDGSPGIIDPAVLGDSVLFIRNVRLVPMDPAGIQEGQSIVVRDGRIAAIGPASTTNAPPGAAVLDSAGRFLIPGLIDAHVHMRPADAPEYLRAGVLTLRNMWGHSRIPPLIAIESGTVDGPTSCLGPPV